MTHGAPSLSSVTSIRAPHGTYFSRWLRIAAYALLGSSPGASRTLILAFATGTSALGAAPVGGASMPSTEIGRLGPDPVADRAAADEPDAVEQPGLTPEPVLGIVDGRAPAAHQAVDRDLAVLVVQCREKPAQHGERVRHRAAEHAAVHGAVQHAHLGEAVDESAQRGGERRHADVPVAGVGDDDDVGAQRRPGALRGWRPATPSRTPPRPRRTRTTPTGSSSPYARSAATCAMMPALSSAAPRP